MSTDASSLPDDPAALKALLLREREQHTAVITHYEQTVQSQLRKLELDFPTNGGRSVKSVDCS